MPLQTASGSGESQLLQGKHVAMLMTDGVEQVEYTDPRSFLEKHGAQVTLIAPKPKDAELKGFNHLSPGQTFRVEMDVRDARPELFDALVLPGGVANPDMLRLSEDAIGFIRNFAGEGKTIAAICHGPWTLIDAGVVQGRQVTSWPSLKNDLANAGAEWSDEAVVVDGKLVTSRKSDDLPAFDEALLQALTAAPAEAAAPEEKVPTPNVAETVHNVQEEPGSQMTG